MQFGHGSGCFWKEHLRSKRSDQKLEQKMQNQRGKCANQIKIITQCFLPNPFGPFSHGL